MDATGPVHGQRRSVWLTLGLVLAIAGAGVLLIAFLASIPSLIEAVQGVLLDRVLRVTSRRLIVLASIVILVGATIVLVARVGRRHPTRGLAAAFLVFVAVRLVADVVLDGPLVSDWLLYEQLARAALHGAPPIADLPMGYPYVLALGMSLLGTGPATAEVVNLVLALAGAGLLAAWVELLADRRTAAIAVLLLAICPSQVLYGLIVGTEVIYSAALVSLALLGTLVVRRLRNSGTDPTLLALAAVAGLVLGASAYVRATSFAIGPLFVLLPVLATGRPRAAAPAVITMVLATAIALAPAIVTNRVLLDRWSPSTSLYLGWQLYVGTGIEHAGRWNADDVATLDAAAPGTDVGRLEARWSTGDIDIDELRAAADRDDVALALARERIAAEGPRLLTTVPTKAANAWGPADDAAFWVFGGAADSNLAARAIWDLASQVWWVLALAAALLGIARRARGTRDALLVASVSLVPLALGLLVLEATGRYHEPVVPLVAGLAAFALSRGTRLAPDPDSPASLLEELPVRPG